MQVRIVRAVQRAIDGVDAATLQKGEVYELSALAGNVLIAEGLAMLEMRRGERRQYSGALPPTIVHDRRTHRRR